MTEITSRCATWISVKPGQRGLWQPSRYHGGEMELRIDGRDGEVIGTLRIPYTGEWENWGEFATDVKSVTGVHDLYFVCKGKKPHELFNFDYWCFK